MDGDGEMLNDSRRLAILNGGDDDYEIDEGSRTTVKLLQNARELDLSVEFTSTERLSTARVKSFDAILEIV
eukprot:scaffold180509_cov35-Tisochrysis_lutea.AAC.2